MPQDKLLDEERKDEASYDQKMIMWVHKLKRVLLERVEETTIQVRELIEEKNLLTQMIDRM
jgi:hypothetical protein